MRGVTFSEKNGRTTRPLLVGQSLAFAAFSRKLGVSLHAALGEIDAFVFLLFADADAHRQLD